MSIGNIVSDAKDVLAKLAGNKEAIGVAEQAAVLIGGDRAATAIKIGEAVVGAMNTVAGVAVAVAPAPVDPAPEQTSSTIEPPVAGSITATLAQRGSRYGDFTDHACVCQALKKVMVSQPGWAKLSDVQKQALEVIADKQARILTGDPDYDDNWHDIQGYAKLVEDRLPVNQIAPAAQAQETN